MTEPLPSRFTNLEEARRGFGVHVDRLGSFLNATDPLADELVATLGRLRAGKGRQMVDVALEQGIKAVPNAPAALRALFAQVDEVPLWVDWEQLDRGGAAHRRCGLAGGLILACCSLPLIYGSPAGNKPLIFSGQLVYKAARRLSETARFAQETCLPGGLRRFGKGWKITINVRLMHAQIRRLLWNSQRWNASDWGAPVNQVDLVATNLLFSVAQLDHLRRIGFHFSRAEGESVMQLWRYSGYLLGIDPALLCATETEGRRLLHLIHATQGPPDQDAQKLTRALMEQAIPGLFPKDKPYGPSRLTALCYGLSYTLLGKPFAENLAYPKTYWRYTAPARAAGHHPAGGLPAPGAGDSSAHRGPGHAEDSKPAGRQCGGSARRFSPAATATGRGSP